MRKQQFGNLALSAVGQPSLTHTIGNVVQRIGFVVRVEMPANRLVRERGVASQSAPHAVHVSLFDQASKGVIAHHPEMLTGVAQNPARGALQSGRRRKRSTP
ncbi:MAG TPA: hypothetical protein VJT80_22700 [Steroidobacteraceae bacterium]|nr:hypothetical protein [Steroidobacteraceae bacterium]